MDLPSPPPNMQDVARAAGVHQTTVSRALRNDRRVSVATRRRVQELAAAMGYRPNPLVSALITQRRSRRLATYRAAVAMVMRDDYRRATVRSQMRDYHAGAVSAADGLGYQIERFLVGAEGLTHDRLDAVLMSRNILGVILAPLPDAHGHFELSWDLFSTVAIESTFNEPVFDRVLHDNYGGMRRIMAECRCRGLRRVGLALSTVAYERTERLNGAAYWVEQQADDFFPAVSPWIRDGWSESGFAAWFTGHQLEVVVTSNDFLPQIQNWCAKSRLAVARDVHLINVNSRAPEVSGISQNPGAIGAMAVRLLVEKINRNDRGVPERPHTTVVPGAWRAGETLGGASDRAAVLGHV